MKSSTKYIVYLLALHLLISLFAWLALADQPYWFLAVEALLLVSAYVGYQLYRDLIAPLGLLSLGASALADRDFSVRLVPTGSAEMDGLVGVYNQMVDQLRQERVAARQQEVFLDRVINGAQLGVAVLDFEGRLTSMNEWLQERADAEDFRAEVLDPAIRLATAEPLSELPLDDPLADAGEPLHPRPLTGPGNRRYRVEHGTFIDRGFERRFLVLQDVSAELLNAEKTAYGKVIRMMAHEVNNSNAAVGSVLESLHAAAVTDADDVAQLCREYLPVVLARSNNLTTFMRRFADVIRLPAPRLRPTDLNAVLTQTGDLLRPMLREHDISLELSLADHPVRVPADRSLLEQVILNAVTNARESIGSGGTVRLTTTKAPAGFVIADDGPGIPADHQASLFTPFFSSKPSGQGVGLTLTRDILERHGATYTLASGADGWTRLRVVF